MELCVVLPINSQAAWADSYRTGLLEALTRMSKLEILALVNSLPTAPEVFEDLREPNFTPETVVPAKNLEGLRD
ncbi:hypothetical protein EVG20_g10122 [Dentipellis fragilis]|uniref:Uncharacterized protein n=1 Tax=Dentipellis fragilis TaxID=205917 RepID=A0A4Y9XTN9_9AGAM|nr:hypothetical protein EVG20_g10122 [Dentipellis fragilis]